MNHQSVPIHSLTPDPANLRLHDTRNLEAIKNSLARFGQQKPIVVNTGNIVIAGNGTLAAAKLLGWKEINIVRTTLSGAEATAYAIADNRSAELASWDDPALARTLEALRLEDETLGDVTGFDPEELATIADEPDPVRLPTIRQVIVDCPSEGSQHELYDRLTEEGFSCRVSTL